MRPLPPTPTRRVLPIAILLVLAAMAALALAQIGGAPRARAATISAASGSFQITNSHEGAPIFAATNIAPGGSASGTVTIEDASSEAVSLRLHRGELVDVPGTGGGVLSGRLQLTVVDITVPQTPVTVYTGPLDTMPDQIAGELAAGEAHTYRFTATLPGGGTAAFQNAVQGAGTTVEYSWVAEEAGGGEEEGGGEEGGEKGGEGEGGGGGNGGGGTGSGGNGSGGGQPAGSGSANVASGGSGAGGSTSGALGGNLPPSVGGGGGARPRDLDLVVPRAKRAIRGGSLVVWTTCSSACRLRVRGSLRATAAGAHRVYRIRFAKPGLLAPGAKRLSIPIPRKLRHWIKTAPGRPHIRAKLRFTAIATDGERAVVRKTLRLRVHRPRR